MDDERSSQSQVISAANVLMIALLKMNRVLIPAILRWRRGSRLRWIQDAERDVQRRARGDAFRNQMLPRRAPASSSTPDPPAGSAPTDEGNPNPAPDDLQPAVEAERKRRTERTDVFVYTSMMTVTVTICSIVLYSGVIIALALSLFKFGRGEALVFAFSLVATATVSEAEVLLKWKKRAEKRDSTDPANYRVVSSAPGLGDPMGTAEAGVGEAPSGTGVGQGQTVEYFSDMD